MQKIKLLSTNNSTEEVQTAIGLMVAPCEADGNVDVAADGTDAGAQNTTLGTKKGLNDTAHLNAKNATEDELTQKKVAIKSYNKAAKKVMEVYDGNTTKYTELGFDLTKIGTPADELTAVLGGEAHLSPFPGKVEVGFDVLHGADDYLLEECEGDTTLPTAIWYPANPVSTKIHSARIIPKTRGVILSWRVTGENTFGPGAPGLPFGGFQV
jgi:hypothetical protein